MDNFHRFHGWPNICKFKIKSANKAFALFYHMTVTSIFQNFIPKCSFSEPPVNISCCENFPLYGITGCLHHYIISPITFTYMGNCTIENSYGKCGKRLQRYHVKSICQLLSLINIGIDLHVHMPTQLFLGD